MIATSSASTGGLGNARELVPLELTGCSDATDIDWMSGERWRTKSQPRAADRSGSHQVFMGERGCVRMDTWLHCAAEGE